MIWAHNGYGRDVFDLFFQALTPERRASIRVAAGDGARWIDSCVSEWCPNAERVLDGFHIVSWMTDALDKVRKRLWNQARRDGDGEAAKRLRGVRYAVLKNPEDLTGRQSEAFDRLADTDPRGQPYRTWRLKELLRTLLRHPVEQAEDELNHWMFRASHSRIPEIVELAKKIRRRRPDILRTIRLGYPNTRLEASDSRIKVNPHGLRFPPREQPHRAGHAPLRRTRHTATPTRHLTHENNRSLSMAVAQRRMLPPWSQPGAYAGTASIWAYFLYGRTGTIPITTFVSRWGRCLSMVLVEWMKVFPLSSGIFLDWKNLTGEHSFRTTHTGKLQRRHRPDPSYRTDGEWKINI